MNRIQERKSARVNRPGRYRLRGPVVLLIIVLALLVVQRSPDIRHAVLGLFQSSQTTQLTETTTITEPFPQDETTSSSEPGTGQNESVPTTSEQSDQPVTLTAVGDIILHQSVIDGGKINSEDQENNSYNFSPAFQFVAPILQTADLSLCNFEGTLAGPPFSGFPLFSAPDAIVDALYDAGFRGVWTANNHILDKGLDGLVRTTSVFQEKGFQVIGSRINESEQSDCVINVQGYQIGLMAYTFETIGTETQRALNSIPIPDEALPLLDSFNPYRADVLEQDLAALIERSVQLRQNGAELICLSLHWGHEYKTQAADYQKMIAQQLADEGIELIIGHHPHVLQPVEILTSLDESSQTLVFYSIGNFLHNMTFSTHNTAGYAQDAMIARVSIDRIGRDVQVVGAEIIPTYVTRNQSDRGLLHTIVPVLPAIDDPEFYQSKLTDLTASWQRIQKVLEPSIRTGKIPISFSSR